MKVLTELRNEIREYLGVTDAEGRALRYEKWDLHGIMI